MYTRSAIAQLGLLFKAFRESKGLTQSEVVKGLKSEANRSVIAHLEQGLRLPQPHVLRELGFLLGIPEQLWIAFESTEIRSSVNMEPEKSLSIFRPRIIAVSGIMGSGKTTLAKQLARAFGYLYVSESSRSTQYLNDLFEDPKRWAFEVQTAFLFNKANEIKLGYRKGYGLVIDRTLSEDSDVFAKYFYRKGDIEKRSYELYTSFSNYFLQEIPLPDLVIFCELSIDKAIERIRKRGRNDEIFHSREHLLEISELYNDWIEKHKESTICHIDSGIWDWRESKILHQITREIEEIYTDKEYVSQQLSLFDYGKNKIKPKKSRNKIINVKFKKKVERDYFFGISNKIIDLNPFPYPSAYIAAPFTGVAGDSNDDINDLFERPHGTIKRGRFKDALLDIEKNLMTQGFVTVIPHRDVNEWGRIILNPKQVTSICTEQVSHVDLFVGLLGNSHGAHYEFGIARGKGKPCIIIHCNELGESFIAEGVTGENASVLSISANKISNIRKRFMEEDVVEFIKRRFL